MPQLKASTFTAYVFSEQELQAACAFSSLNILYIKTIQADAAQQKLNLVLDPYLPLKYTQDESFLAGQIAILQYLLDITPIVAVGDGSDKVAGENWLERYGPPIPTSLTQQ